MHELPLVFFTVLSQSAVGAFVLLLCFSQYNGRQLGGRLFATLCLFGIGLAIGVFHMGQLLRAINLFFGIGRSPMSDEIALSALFGILGAISALGLLSGKGSQLLFKSIGWLAALGAGKNALWVAVIGMIASLLIRPSYLSILWRANSALTSEQTLWFGLQVLLILVALIATLFVIFKRAPSSWIYASATSVIMAELLGRVAFYNMWTITM
ncbi:DmsC/YnfH family molybdoenzyme membrane anchor subunit [Providencia burhodogranariea]|uniref:Anaerobic reductase subunit C n=1 Tax=Providencia burhodogranariea DSM 19968 TaxID=1141662 RepID=K8WST6_9GAMM|nr:DmsC/YnfH family molybdoenzyme membrane anchor subunit [Providencia burhodogranariea]EKT63001.1 anaerobic reductase subunit C [Providencia burhodogranariea DSM 19968]